MTELVCLVRPFLVQETSCAFGPLTFISFHRSDSNMTYVFCVDTLIELENRYDKPKLRVFRIAAEHRAKVCAQENILTPSPVFVIMTDRFKAVVV